MSITIGRPAPTLAVEAWIRGIDAPAVVEVPATNGDWTVLAFYPADFTFVCPTELRAFAESRTTSARPALASSPRAPTAIGRTARGSRRTRAWARSATR